MTHSTVIDRLMSMRQSVRTLLSRPDTVPVDLHWSQLDDLDAAIIELEALNRQNLALRAALDAALNLRPQVQGSVSFPPGVRGA